MYGLEKVIYKYTLPLKDGREHSVRMPMGAQVIHVGVQGLNICLWAIVNPLPEEYVERQFFIMGTGDPFEYNPNFTPHIWTVQMVDPDNSWGQTEFVWHVFERLNPDATR